MIRVWFVVVLLFALAACRDQSRAPAKTAEITVKLNPVFAKTEGDAIEYKLKFPDAKNHYVELEAIFPANGEPTTLAMAVWTPGSYIVREYSRNIDGLTASTLSGDPLAVYKTRKNRWAVATAGQKRFVVRYRVYCRDLAVQDLFIDADSAVLNGAGLYLMIPGRTSTPYDVRIEKPANWSKLVTALPPHQDGAPDHFLAPNFDILLDDPFIAGDVATYPFKVDGVDHTLAVLGEGGVWDGPRSAKDLEQLTHAEHDLWQVVPYRRYFFLNVLTDGKGGGLEHLESTLMMVNRQATRKKKTYHDWLSLVAHEFFHAWNVKRMRPVALGPFDYENEVYTPSLWIAEGFTSYYDDLLLSRAGLITEDEYLDMLSREIEELEMSPGRNVQPVADASFDAWIKFYRKNENSNNTTINYYRKGAVLGLLLDAEIRDATSGSKSLDDMMRLVYQRYSGDKGYTPNEFYQVASEVAKKPLDGFFHDYVEGTKPLNYAPVLKRYGLRFISKEKKDPAKKDDEPAGYLGADVPAEAVKSVDRDSPAYAAGVNVEDEILAIDGYRVAPGKLAERLETLRPGSKVKLLVARRGQLKALDVTLGTKPENKWKLEVDPDAPGPTRRQREQWLRPSPAHATRPQK